MIVIRVFFGGWVRGSFTVLSLLAIPGIFLLYYSAQAEQAPPPVIEHSACQYGVYNFDAHDNWQPANGSFPQLANGQGYAVKITTTDISATQDLYPQNAPSVSFSHSPWQVNPENEQIWQGYNPGPNSSGLTVTPGESVVAYDPLTGGSASTPPPAGCSVSP
jgi:hypothetical protein